MNLKSLDYRTHLEFYLKCGFEMLDLIQVNILSRSQVSVNACDVYDLGNKICDDAWM